MAATSGASIPSSQLRSAYEEGVAIDHDCGASNALNCQAGPNAKNEVVKSGTSPAKPARFSIPKLRGSIVGLYSVVTACLVNAELANSVKICLEHGSAVAAGETIQAPRHDRF
jgi:hypothetical protein